MAMEIGGGRFQRIEMSKLRIFLINNVSDIWLYVSTSVTSIS